MGFRVLSQDEFDALSTRERIEYLRQAIQALDELKDQVRVAILRDEGDQVRQVPYQDQ